MRRFDLFKRADTGSAKSSLTANSAAADGDVYTSGTSGLYAATCSAYDAGVYTAAEAANSGLYTTIDSGLYIAAATATDDRGKARSGDVCARTCTLCATDDAGTYRAAAAKDNVYSFN